MCFLVYDVFTGAAPEPYVTILKEKGLLQCKVPGASPKPTVEWWDSDNKTLPSKMVQAKEEQGRFSITIQTTVTEPGCYWCVTTQIELWHRISSEICVHDGEWYIILQTSVTNKVGVCAHKNKLGMYLLRNH